MPRPSTLFIYALGITLVAFILRDPGPLAFLAVPHFLLGFILGYRRFKILILIFLLGMTGLYLNVVAVHAGPNLERFLASLLSQEVITGFLSIAFRLMAITGATMIFLSLVEPYPAVKSLEEDLYLPKGVAFSIYYALRLLPLIQRLARDISNVRRMRGARQYIATPGDFIGFLRPLLSILVERALWTGIAAELRGFARRRPRRRGYRPGPIDILVLTLLVSEVLIALQLPPDIPLLQPL